MRKLCFTTEEIYHVYNRGVNKRIVFETSLDYQRFVDSFNRFTNQDVTILAYCLMPNHFHFLLEQLKEGGITRFLHKITMSHAKYYNASRDRTGALFEPKFKAKHVNHASYYSHISKYIHLNPLSLCRYKTRKQQKLFLTNYPWSSLHEYLDMRKNRMVDLRIMNEFQSKYDYMDYIFCDTTPGVGDTGC